MFARGSKHPPNLNPGGCEALGLTSPQSLLQRADEIIQ
jgi:hypothetical protein